MSINLLIVTVLVFVLNIPFGYWRANVRKFSLQWVLSIHIPVPIIIALRIYGNVGFQWHTYVFLVAAFFSGQKIGYLIHKKMKSKYADVGSFLLGDLLRLKKQ